MTNIQKALAIQGWMSEPELTWLAEQAQQSQVIVEVGSHVGRSIRALADNTQETLIAVGDLSQGTLRDSRGCNNAENPSAVGATTS